MTYVYGPDTSLVPRPHPKIGIFRMGSLNEARPDTACSAGQQICDIITLTISPRLHMLSNYICSTIQYE